MNNFLTRALVSLLAPEIAQASAGNYNALAEATGGKTTTQMAKEVQLIVAGLNTKSEQLTTEAEKVETDAGVALQAAIAAAHATANGQYAAADAKRTEAEALAAKAARLTKAVKFFGA